MQFIRSEFHVCGYRDGIVMFYINPYEDGLSMISLYYSPNNNPDYFLLGMLEISSLDMDYVYNFVNEFVNTAICQSLITDIIGDSTEFSIHQESNVEDYRTGKKSYLN